MEQLLPDQNYNRCNKVFKFYYPAEELHCTSVPNVQVPHAHSHCVELWLKHCLATHFCSPEKASIKPPRPNLDFSNPSSFGKATACQRVWFATRKIINELIIESHSAETDMH